MKQAVANLILLSLFFHSGMVFANPKKIQCFAEQEGFGKNEKKFHDTASGIPFNPGDGHFIFDMTKFHGTVTAEAAGGLQIVVDRDPSLSSTDLHILRAELSPDSLVQFVDTENSVVGYLRCNTVHDPATQVSGIDAKRLP